jgi:hypothetical protein
VPDGLQWVLESSVMAIGCSARLSEHLDGDAAAMYRHACAMGRRDREQAPRCTLQVRPLAALDQGEESEQSGGEADRGNRVVEGS